MNYTMSWPNATTFFNSCFSRRKKYWAIARVMNGIKIARHLPFAIKCLSVVMMPHLSNGDTKATAVSEKERVFAISFFLLPQRTSLAILITGDNTCRIPRACFLAIAMPHGAWARYQTCAKLRYTEKQAHFARARAMIHQTRWWECPALSFILWHWSFVQALMNYLPFHI